MLKVVCILHFPLAISKKKSYNKQSKMDKDSDMEEIK